MDESTIKKRAVKGIIWKFSERFFALFVSLIVSIVIARIIDPEDYSLVSFVTIFFTFANIIIAGGFNSALMQKQDADAEDYSAVLYISLMMSVIIYFVLFFCAPLIANLYDQKDLILIIRVMGITLPVNAIKSIWCAYLSSELNFKKFFYTTLIGTIISAIVGITMAVAGFGAWALVAQQMTNIVIDTLLLVISTRVPLVFRISFPKLKKLFNYGSKVFLSSLIGVIYVQIVPLIIGLKFTNADLAFYTKAKSFPDMILNSTTSTLAAVLFPTFAKFQDDKKTLLKYTRKFISLASYIVFPLMLGFFAVADNLIQVLLTDKWIKCVPYIRIFCVASMFSMLEIGNCETIKAMGRSGTYLIMEIIKKSGYFITIFLFTCFAKTPEALALNAFVCTAIATTVNAIPNIKLLDYKIGMQLKDFILNLVTAAIMCVAVTFMGKLPINIYLLLALQVIAGIGLYVLISVITKNKNFYIIYNAVRGFFKKSKPEVIKETSSTESDDNIVAETNNVDKTNETGETEPEVTNIDGEQIDNKEASTKQTDDSDNLKK